MRVEQLLACVKDEIEDALIKNKKIKIKDLFEIRLSKGRDDIYIPVIIVDTKFIQKCKIGTK